jgi:hypothetical protein
MPDDDQDGAGDGDLGFGLAAAAGDPAVALAEESGGAVLRARLDAVLAEQDEREAGPCLTLAAEL